MSVTITLIITRNAQRSSSLIITRWRHHHAMCALSRAHTLTRTRVRHNVSSARRLTC